jgi:hypothetical protein
MNTNYSKIALLLALGVIAGDKVGAEPVAFYPKTRAGFGQLASDGCAADIARKRNDIVKPDPITKSLVEHLNAFDTNNFGSLVVKGFQGGKALSVDDLTKDADLRRLLNQINESAKSEKAAVKSAVKLFKDLAVDLQSITDKRTESLQTIYNGKSRSDQIKALVQLANNTGGEIIDDQVIKGIASLSVESKFKVLPTDTLLLGLSGARHELSTAINNLPATTAVEEGGNKQIYDMNKVKEAIENFANVTFSKFAEASLGRQPISSSDLEKIKNISRQVSAYKELARQLNFANKAGYNKFADKVASSGITEWFKSVEGAKTEFLGTGALAATNVTGAQKGTAIRTFLNKVFDETENLDSDNKATVFSTGQEGNSGMADTFVADGIMQAMGFVTDGSVAFVDASDGTTMENNKTTSADKELPKKLYGKWFSQVQTALDSVKPKSSNKDMKIRAFNEFLDAKSSSAAVEFDKGMNDAAHTDVTAYFRSLVDWAEKNKATATFAEKAKISKEMADRVWAGFEEIYKQEEKNLLSPSAKSRSKMFENFNRDSIISSHAQIKALYDKVLQGLNVPAAAPAAEAPKTIDDLLNSDAFKKTSLKVAELSQEIRGLIASAKDQVAAQTLFAKILPGVPAADVEALKALFSDDVKGKLVVKPEADPSAKQTNMTDLLPPANGEKDGSKPATTRELDTEDRDKDKDKDKDKVELDDEEEEVTLEDLDLVFLDPKTGKLLKKELLKEDDAKEALESLNKFLADTMTSLKGDSKKPVPVKTRKEKADSIINELVENFTKAYDGEDPEDEEDEKKQKDLTAAKNKAVDAAKDEITTKVYKAFNIKKAPAGKGKRMPAKRGSKSNAKGGRQRGRILKNIKPRASNRNDKKNEKK